MKACVSDVWSTVSEVREIRNRTRTANYFSPLFILRVNIDRYTIMSLTAAEYGVYSQWYSDPVSKGWAKWTVGMVSITNSYMAQFWLLTHLFCSSLNLFRITEGHFKWGESYMRWCLGSTWRQRRGTLPTPPLWGHLVTAAGIPGSRPPVRCCPRNKSSPRSLPNEKNNVSFYRL